MVTIVCEVLKSRIMHCKNYIKNTEESQTSVFLKKKLVITKLTTGLIVSGKEEILRKVTTTKQIFLYFFSQLVQHILSKFRLFFELFRIFICQNMHLIDFGFGVSGYSHLVIKGLLDKEYNRCLRIVCSVFFYLFSGSAMVSRTKFGGYTTESSEKRLDNLTSQV